MIVTIKTKRSKMPFAKFEALKFGLDFEAHADDTFDLTVHDNTMLDHIVKSCSGTVIAKQNYVSNGGGVM